MDRTRGSLCTCPFLFLAGGAILAALLVAPPLSIEPGRDVTLPALGPPVEPTLDLDPATWWMPAGNSTGFSAAWIDPPEGCGLTAVWFRWAIVGAPVEGALNGTVGPNVTFVASSSVTGTSTLRVRSAAVIDCPGGSTATVGQAEANVTVVAPVAIGDLALAPDPAVPGENVSLAGNLTGGEPPYVVTIAWGGGTSSSLVVGAPGRFSAVHAYPSGTYQPDVVATDSSGRVGQATVDEPLTVSDSTAVGITAPGSSVDVGVTMSFVARVLDEPSGSATGWRCSSDAPAAPASANGTNFSCGFSETGTGEVFFEIDPPVPYLPVSTTLVETVEALPTLVANGSTQVAEVGQPFAVAFNVSGGVPPFRLRWSEVGTSTEGTLSVPSDGRVLVPLDPVLPGSLELVARLVDADGVGTENATTGLFVEPPLNLSASAERSLGATAADLAIDGSASAGAPPFLWIVTPSVAPKNGTALEGSLASIGSFGWAGNYTVVGGVNVSATVVDAAGGFASVTFALEAVAPLVGGLVAGPAPPSTPASFEIDLTLSGGLPPFELNVSASDGARWNLTIRTDGADVLPLNSTVGGPLFLSARVSDSLGSALEWNTSVTVVAPPATPPAPSSPPPSAAPAPLATGTAIALGLAAVGAALAALYLRRHRTPPGAGPRPDATAVLRRIIEPADGADRATVELLAEEAGVPLEEARATIDRLIADGTLRAETDPDGEEVLAWATLGAA